MVSPSTKRRAVRMVVEEGWGRKAPACRALGLCRASFYVESQVCVEMFTAGQRGAGVMIDE
ncbi:MAG: hypothetical protein SFU85_02370 [Candidatus Methylacidiphilales bacterium]|nr:hypothetical protein [Candidatus Methylacidiphilales bacterium]